MKTAYFWIVLLSAPWAACQTSDGGVFRGSITLGDMTVWGQVLIPRGSYSLSVQYTHNPVAVTLRSADGEENTFVPLTILAGAENGRAEVCLAIFKDRWHVRSVDLPELGISLLFMPRNQRYDVRAKCIPTTPDSQSGV